jgi:hypothetical protein
MMVLLGVSFVLKLLEQNKHTFNKKEHGANVSKFVLGNALFAWLISHQPAVLFSQNKTATSNQPAVLFSQKKPTPAISHQPTEQAGIRSQRSHHREPLGLRVLYSSAHSNFKR